MADVTGERDVPIDPRAVRVSAAPATRLPDDPVLTVGPAPEGLRMTNPSTGVGPLGGTIEVAPAPDDAMEGGVLAQRHLLVDGIPTTARLDAGGRGRALLVEGEGDGARTTRVVLGPAHGSDGAPVRREVLVDGFRFEVEVESERRVALRERASRGRSASAHSGPLEVRAIIPGKVVSVSVAAGDEVEAGQQLLAVEAMKMQNELRSPRDGTIERVGVGVGDNIEVGDLLVVIS